MKASFHQRVSASERFTREIYRSADVLGVVSLAIVSRHELYDWEGAHHNESIQQELKCRHSSDARSCGISITHVLDWNTQLTDIAAPESKAAYLLQSQ